MVGILDTWELAEKVGLFIAVGFASGVSAVFVSGVAFYNWFRRALDSR